MGFLAPGAYSFLVLTIWKLSLILVIASPSDENATELIEKATSLVEAGIENDDDIDMFEEADKIATRAASLKPDDVDIQLGLGDILFAVKEYDRAISSFGLVIGMQPNNFDANFALGMTLGSLGRLSHAEKHLQLSTKIDPTHAGAHQALGTTLGNLNRIQESEAALLRAMTLDPDGDAEEQLRKVWKGGGRAAPGDSGWGAACRSEIDNIENASVRNILQAVRAREADSSWQKRRLFSCAGAVLKTDLMCGHKVVFLEAWEAAWRLVGKLSRKPNGKHVVLGGGLGAVCLFALHFGHVSECHSMDSLCSFVDEVADLWNPAIMSRKPLFSCGPLTSEENMAALQAADVVWLIDGEQSKAMQANVEKYLASVLQGGASLVMFRTPHLSSQNVQPVGVQSVELFCIGSINDRCINYRPAVSWETERNLTAFLLEVSTYPPTSSPRKCVAGTAVCEEDLCTQPLETTSFDSSAFDRPRINTSALPYNSSSRWCDRYPVLEIRNFVSEDELRLLAPHLNARSVNASFEDLGRHPSECTHVWQRTSRDAGQSKEEFALWQRLVERIDDVVGSPWGVVSINEARPEGSWEGCHAGLRNIHHDRNFYPQRFATVILYLTDVEEGGQTIFPFFTKPGYELTEEQFALRESLKAQFLPGAISASPPQQLILSFRHSTGFEGEKDTIEAFCEEADKYFAIRPVAGTAAIFWHEVGERFVWDNFHAGCPVKKGIKWTLQKFAEKFRP